MKTWHLWQHVRPLRQRPKDKSETWLKKLGLVDASNRRVSAYSGGMKRRVNLIAGVLHSPAILFSDEPTVGVDVHSRNVIVQHLKKLMLPAQPLFIPLHMEEAQNFCTRVSIIDNGKSITEGTPAELISRNAGSTNLENVFLNLANEN
ncbi:MAG: ATP-binding cassette domain-containing protein [Chitinophagaceae bacterium]|nr:ATP-binding cassette domain-containing protein [Chitinophagaceae bacterium]